MSNTPTVHESQTVGDGKEDNTADSLRSEDYATPSKYRDEDLDISAKDRSAETLEVTNERRDTPVGDDSVNEEKTVKIDITEGSVTLDMRSDEEGDDTATLPLRKKEKMLEEKRRKEEKKEKSPLFIFPITRLRNAWRESKDVGDFILKAIGIMISTLGWLCCIGGIPFMSLAMLIIGSIYINECNIQPNIPVYLVVAGVFGTLQHFIAVYSKYMPKDSRGRIQVCKYWCQIVDFIIQLFLFIWFILGCIWVYGVPENINFRDSYKDEYCNKTVFYFTLWIFNISFILMALLIVCVLFLILFAVVSPEREYVH